MILISGGARSGKSKFAAGLAKKQCKTVAYIATAPVCDKEMEERVRLHRKARPKSWVTIEAKKDMLPNLTKIPKRCDGVIIECIGTYVSNLMMDGFSDLEIMKNIKKILRNLKKLDKKIFIISNEVGGGIVPDTISGRQFRDIVGNANQIIAKYADEVYLVTIGLPLRIK